jgi:two-component system NtrC family sensor kinase
VSNPPDYHKAYLRQKAAREKAEALLESRARELYDSNQSLRMALDELNKRKTSLVQQEKLASIGLLAAGIAHEINNPVGFVKSNLQTLLGYLAALTKPLNSYLEIADELYAQPMSADIKQQLHSINLLLAEEDIKFITTDSIDSIEEGLAGIKRIEDIISNLSDYSRTESNKRSLVDINQVVEDALKLIWNELKYRCEITKTFGEIPLIYGSSGQLSQIFVNLAINAAQAMESRGTLAVTTTCDQDYIFHHKRHWLRYRAWALCKLRSSKETPWPNRSVQQRRKRGDFYSKPTFRYTKKPLESLEAPLKLLWLATSQTLSSLEKSITTYVSIELTWGEFQGSPNGTLCRLQGLQFLHAASIQLCQ